MADAAIVPHMMPVVGSFLGAMLRGDENFLWTGRLVSLLDSQGSEGRTWRCYRHRILLLLACPLPHSQQL